MTWWLTDVGRAKRERAGVAQLADAAPWLSALHWRFDSDLQLILDFDVSHGGETFALTMEYPSTFPDTPPIVRPRDGRRLSYHQYGEGGELCLEYRPDNWNPSVTGSQMIESAHRLLAGERPTDDALPVVESAHQASLGRDVRGTHWRFVLPVEALSVLETLPLDEPLPIQVWDRLSKPTWVASLVSVSADDERRWSSQEPSPETDLAPGFALRTTREVGALDASELFLAALEGEFPALAAMLPLDFRGFVLLGGSDRWIVINLFPFKEKRAGFSYKVLLAPAAARRLPPEYAALADRRVAIVGCGSVGSKVAIAMARAGVRDFTLVDDDLFFAANIVRNELGAEAIGQHKVDALSTRIKQIVTGAKLQVRQVALGQQESAGTTESVMEQLAKVDLLIDATADPRAFNLVGAVARRNQKPMLWAHVFAGGIGGIVVRLRPGIDPVPASARDQVRAWCDAHQVPWLDAQEDYGARDGAGQVLIADDAEVSIIASHATRMALDTLVREPTRFPSSAYAIGLSSGWIFSAPFDTWPIELRGEGVWGTEVIPLDGAEIVEFLRNLSPKKDPA